eukprot:scaffold128539_cov31-Tisochrysis_lutea.AAC.1
MHRQKRHTAADVSTAQWHAVTRTGARSRDGWAVHALRTELDPGQLRRSRFSRHHARHAANHGHAYSRVDRPWQGGTPKANTGIPEATGTAIGASLPQDARPIVIWVVAVLGTASRLADRVGHAPGAPATACAGRRATAAFSRALSGPLHTCRWRGGLCLVRWGDRRLCRAHAHDAPTRSLILGLLLLELGLDVLRAWSHRLGRPSLCPHLFAPHELHLGDVRVDRLSRLCVNALGGRARWRRRHKLLETKRRDSTLLLLVERHSPQRRLLLLVRSKA